MTTQVRKYKNNGFRVTTRILSWSQMVREAEGSRWNLPIGKSFFGENGERVFVQYNDAVTGPNGA